MIETLKWLRQKYDAIKHAMAASVSAKPETTVDQTKPEQDFADAFSSFTDFFGNIANNLRENTYLQQFITLGEKFRNSGYRSGHWGIQDDNLQDTANLHVRVTKSLIDEKCKSNQERLKSHVEILETIKENADNDYHAKNAYYEKLNRAYQYSHRQFSLTLGFIYGFFSLVLVLADIPLALELTKRGLNLKSDRNSRIADLFAYGTPEGFFNHTMKVLTDNWEVVLFATGIAFCTIYIKVFYDDFIGSPLENLIKKASESPRAEYEEIFLAESKRGATNDGEPNDDESVTAEKRAQVTKRFNRLWWVRFGVKLTVLIVLFVTIVVLGYFRYSVVRLEAENQKQFAVQLANQTASPNTSQLADNPVTIATTSPLVVFLTYSLLTLIFPIVSGICASLSLNSFHNWSERRKIGKETAAARKVALKATEDYMLKREEKTRTDGFLTWLDDPKTENQLVDYLINCYQSGYKFGYLYPKWVWGGDLYTRAEALRNRNLINPPAAAPIKPVAVPETALN
jgi:hypothetical protein